MQVVFSNCCFCLQSICFDLNCITNRHNLDYWPMKLLERTTLALQEDFLPQKMVSQMLLSKARASDAVPEGLCLRNCEVVLLCGYCLYVSMIDF